MHCDDEYIAESKRAFRERIKEHLRVPLPILEHSKTVGHQISVANFTIVGRELHNLVRTIKEAIYMRVNDPIT